MLTFFILAVSTLVSLSVILFTSAPIWLGLLAFPATFLLIVAGFMAVVALAGAGVDRTKPIERVSPLCRRCCDGIAGFLCFFGLFRIELRGLEKLPKDQCILLVSNHRSAVDPMVMAKTLKDYNVAFVSKLSNMALPALGRMAYGAGFLGIDRENDRNALKTILTAAGYIKKGICSVCIYPEGTRSRDGKLLEFHAGSFKIAQKAGAPIAVVCSTGTEKVSGNLRRLRSTRVGMDILELIPAETVKAMGSAELAEYSRRLIADRIAELEG